MNDMEGAIEIMSAVFVTVLDNSRTANMYSFYHYHPLLLIEVYQPKMMEKVEKKNKRRTKKPTPTISDYQQDL